MTPAMRFREAGAIVRALVEAPEGRMSFAQIRSQTQLPADELEETLVQMVDGGILRQAGRSQYELGAGTREVLAAPRAREAPGLRKGKRGKARSEASSR